LSRTSTAIVLHEDHINPIQEEKLLEDNFVILNNNEKCRIYNLGVTDCHKWLCVIVHSSQVIILHFFSTVAKDDYFSISHTASELFWIFSGNLNAKWAVLTPSNNVAAISDDATANAMP
jgi:hypothetical protein